MKNSHKFLLFIVILIISAYLISALEWYIDVTEPQPEKKGERASIEKAPPEPEKTAEKEKTECEQQGGICRCSCLEIEYGGYGRLGCALFGCGVTGLGSYECCKPREIKDEIVEAIKVIEKEELKEADKVALTPKDIKQKVIERQEEMRQLARENPREFLRMAFPKSIISQFREDLQPYFEQEITIEGDLAVLHIDDFENGKSQEYYFLQKETGGLFGKKQLENFNLFIVGEPPSVPSSSRVNVKGYKIGNDIVVNLEQDADWPEPSKEEYKQYLAGDYYNQYSQEYEESAFQQQEQNLPREPLEQAQRKREEHFIKVIKEPIPEALGEQRVAVILIKARYTDIKLLPAQDEVYDFIFNGFVQKFFGEASYNKMWLSGKVYGWYVLGENVPPTPKSVLSADIFPKVIILVDKSIDFQKYDSIMIGVATEAGRGEASIGKIYLETEDGLVRISVGSFGIPDRDSFLKESRDIGTFLYGIVGYSTIHELSHGVLAISHANAWECGANILRGECEHIEYGNYFDVMGSRHRGFHYNAYFKKRAKWLIEEKSEKKFRWLDKLHELVAKEEKIIIIRRAGTYKLKPLEEKGAVAAEIMSYYPNSPSYYAEYRLSEGPIGFDRNLISTEFSKSNLGGLFINWKNDELSTRLLDMSPKNFIGGFDDWQSVALVPSKTFFDEGSGIKITNLGENREKRELTFSVEFLPVECKRDFAISEEVDGGIVVYISEGLRQKEEIEEIEENYYVEIRAGRRFRVRLSFINLDSAICPKSTYEFEIQAPRSWLQGSSPKRFYGKWGDKPMSFLDETGNIYALFGIPKDTKPGDYKIVLQVRNIESGKSKEIGVRVKVIESLPSKKEEPKKPIRQAPAYKESEPPCPDDCYDENRDGIVDVFDMVEVAGKIEKAIDNKEREKLLNRLVCIKQVFGEKPKEGTCSPIQAQKSEFTEVITPSSHGYIIQFKDEPIIRKKVELERKVKHNKQKIANMHKYNPLKPIAEIFYLSEEDVPITLKKHKNNIQKIHRKFRDDLTNRLHKKLRTAVSGYAVKANLRDRESRFIREYEKVFNGVALDLSENEIEQFKKLNYIKNIYPNIEVYNSLFDSVPLIGADKVWQLDKNLNSCEQSSEDCLTGKGITVAVIDTGVDYTHPDLMGKVIAQYCYCSGAQGIRFPCCPNNLDSQEGIGAAIDYQGHGTHVASIIAGNGVIKAVAPDSKIVAIKGEDSYGVGFAGDIISAIERAVDLNQDGDFSDHVDVISMSLGSSGDSYDPQSQAVDNAVSLGVVAVLAAGNKGAKETIDSPGTSIKSITVGATYNNNYAARKSFLITKSILDSSLISKFYIGSLLTTENSVSFPVGNSILTSDAGVNGDLIDGDSGSSEELAKNNFIDKIALIKIDKKISIDEQIQNVYNVGAVGVIFYHDDDKNENVIPYLSFNAVSKIPAVTVSGNSGVGLRTIITPLRPTVNVKIIKKDVKIESVPPSNSDLQPNTQIIGEVLEAGKGLPSDFSSMDFNGKIALIKRGEITFTEKVNNAYNSGAIGIIIYNNKEGSIQPKLTDKTPIPMVFISQKDGEYLLKIVQNSKVVAEISFIIKPDTIAPFSSQGPTISGVVKPDVVAPGVAICAAQSSKDKIWREIGGDKTDIHCIDNQHISISGTSMATPHVSGVVALLKQKNPDWSPDEIKMALRNTAIDIGEPIIVQGYGRIDALGAIQLKNPPPVATILTFGNVFGAIDVIGTAIGREFRSYTLDFGQGESPSAWTKIAESDKPVQEGKLAILDTSVLPIGTYSLRLTVTDSNNHISQDRAIIKVNNAFISSPKALENLFAITKGVINIEGTAAGSKFNNYKLEYTKMDVDPTVIVGAALKESSWHEIVSSDIPITNSILGKWDTSLVEDGIYKIKLTVKTEQGETQDTVLLKIDNTYISSPQPGEKVEDTIDIIGTASGTGFKNYIVEYARDDKLNEFIRLKSSEKTVVDDVLATLDATALEEGHYYKIILKAKYETKEAEDISWVYKGWRFSTYNPLLSSVAIGELDPIYDGLEIVITSNFATRPGYVFVMHNDGALLEGWPVRIEEPISTNSPAIADINGDGRNDIIIASKNKIYVFNSDGTSIPGWPFEMPIKQSDNWNSPEACPKEQIVDTIQWSSPVVVDLDKDKKYEIIVGSTSLRDYCILQGEESSVVSGEVSGGSLYMLKNDGTLANGWPKDMGVPVQISPTVADIDNDGYPEIIVGGGNEYLKHQYIHVFSYDGNEKLKISLKDNYYMIASPAIADIDLDGKYEIIAPLSLSEGVGKIFVYDSNGNLRNDWKWPIDYIGGISSVAIGNIDNDNELELVIGSKGADNNGKVYAFNHDSTFVPGWPIDYFGDASSPIIGNIDEDMDMEILIGSGNGEVGLIYAFNNDGSKVTGWPRATFGDNFVIYGVGSTPVMHDIDNDGITEVISASRDGNVYVWNTVSKYNRLGVEWPMLHHDTLHTGTYSRYVENILLTHLV